MIGMNETGVSHSTFHVRCAYVFHCVSQWEKARSGFLCAEGKSLVFPLKRFHSSKAFPSLPGSKLTCLSDLVILRLRPAQPPTQRIYSLWRHKEKSDKREVHWVQETTAFIFGWWRGVPGVIWICSRPLARLGSSGWHMS